MSVGFVKTRSACKGRRVSERGPLAAGCSFSSTGHPTLFHWHGAESVMSQFVTHHHPEQFPSPLPIFPPPAPFRPSVRPWAQPVSLKPAWLSTTRDTGSSSVDVFPSYRHGVVYETHSAVDICAFLHSIPMFSTCISFVASSGCMLSTQRFYYYYPPSPPRPPSHHIHHC